MRPLRPRLLFQILCLMPRSALRTTSLRGIWHAERCIDDGSHNTLPILLIGDNHATFSFVWGRSVYLPRFSLTGRRDSIPSLCLNSFRRCGPFDPKRYTAISECWHWRFTYIAILTSILPKFFTLQHTKK